MKITGAIIGFLVMALLTTAAVGPAAAAAPEVEWGSLFGGPGPDAGHGVRQTADGGYVVTGERGPDAAGRSVDLYLARFDATGRLVWERNFGGSGEDRGFAVRGTADGGFVVAGTSSSFTSLPALYLLKTGPTGMLQWHRTYSAPYGSGGSSVLQTADGGFVVGGTARLRPGDEDGWLVKVSASGTLQWSRAYSSSGFYDDTIRDVVATAGGFAFCGRTHVAADRLPDGTTPSRAWLLATDTAGNRRWERTYGGPGNDLFNSLAPAADGGYLITGATDPGDGGAALYLVRTDASGSRLWEAIYGDAGDATGTAVLETDDGGCLAAGYGVAVPGGDRVMQLIRTGPDGRDRWTAAVGIPSPAEVHGMQGTADGGFVLAGLASPSPGDGNGAEDACLVKFGPEDVMVVVTIDIKPGSDVNPVNLGSRGLLPVAVLAADGFDPLTVDPLTVLLAGAPVASRRRHLMVSSEDVNADGLQDLLLHFSIGDLQLQPGDQEAVLTGATYGGVAVEGSDRVRVRRARTR